MNTSRTKAEPEPPWNTVSSADIQSALDSEIARVMGRRKSKRKIAVDALPSIRKALIDVFKGDEVLENEAEEALEEEGDPEGILDPFLEEEPKWVIRCSVTDSMMSGIWGLKYFHLGSRGYLFHCPAFGEGDDNECLPIVGTWESSNAKNAAISHLWEVYTTYWLDFGLPPFLGQWAQGPVPFLTKAVGAILKENPSRWPGVLDRLRSDLKEDDGEGNLSQFLVEQAAKLTEQEKSAVATILEDFLKGRKASLKIPRPSDREAHVLVAAFIALLARGGFPMGPLSAHL
jgi:hypothetical protein